MVMMNQARAAVRSPLAPECIKRLTIAEQLRLLGPWQQNLHLPDGTQTAPQHALGDHPRASWRAMSSALPADLTGWRVLDIGCNAGFYTVEFARRGAKVTAMDIDGHCLSQARWAAAQFGVSGHVEFRRNTVYGLANESEQFDLAWCMGVLDNLRYPQLALDVLRRLTRTVLVVELSDVPIVRAAGFRVTGNPVGDVQVCEVASDEAEWSRLAREAELQAVVRAGAE